MRLLLAKTIFTLFMGSFTLNSAIAADPAVKDKGKGSTKKTTSKPKETPVTPGTGLKISEVKLNGSDGKDIVEVAVGSKDHTTLVTAVKAAGLVETLTGPGPYTIFAPTDAAFAKLPKGTVEDLVKPENKLKLKSILEHHAAAPAYHLSTLVSMTEMDMVDGPKLAVKVEGGKVFVDGVEVLAALKAKNGVVYVVDTVLLGK